MKPSRRQAVLWLPAVTAASLVAAAKETLPTKVSRFKDLPVHASGQNRFRPIVEGFLHDGHPVEAHATELAPSNMPHGSHRHKHEELFLIREGAVEVTVNGKAVRLGPGGVAFITSNDEHGIKNVGDTNAHYFVIALGSD